jgi:hypothetical protein
MQLTALKEQVSNKVQYATMRTKLAIGGLIAIGGTSIVGTASAAINFTPIEELLDAVVDLVPTFMDLVIAIAPLIVVIAIVGFVLAFLDRILQMLKFG